MKKRLLTGLIILSSVFGAKAQVVSPNPIEYMISFDANKALYTAWVVPNYSTPNTYNPDTEEKGITAQFSIKVPKGFVLSNLADVHGEWEKTPLKIGGQSQFIEAGVDANYEYYIIGKTPIETNMGEFKSGEPVALFTFKGNSGKNDLKVLEKNDVFVNLAVNQFALNVQPSFYSRSGQKPVPTALPLEQFTKSITLDEVKANISNTIENSNAFKSDPNSSNDMSVYPNPVENDLNIKFFALASEPTEIAVMDVNGKILKTDKVISNTGYTTSKIALANLQGGIYYVKTTANGVTTTKKVVK